MILREKHSMVEEMRALDKNNTWELVSLPAKKKKKEKEKQLGANGYLQSNRKQIKY